eukprot:TRINITY_DN3620_c0_g1_i10.p3 TRINITY_DN3620_c0_g1~~TRINITY_DN3620_c0_g1_i10.p3  ORF type:complete len:113 (+),score=3.56 TRINITY_DN3620_c0_g1_i10:1954-2292(+)
MFSHTRKKTSSFGDKIKSFFVDTIGGGIKRAWNWVSGGVKSIVSTAHKDVTGIVSGVSNIITHGQDAVTGTIKEVSHDVRDLGSNVSHDLSSMAMPLAIGGVAIAALMLMKK